MIVTCPTCERRYNDEYRWTICPHMPLEASHIPFHPVTNPRGYCEQHDLFCCRLHEGESMENEVPARQSVGAIPAGISGGPATLGIPPSTKGPLQLLQFNPLHMGGTELEAAADEIVAFHAVDEDQRLRLRYLEQAAARFLQVLSTYAPPGPERSTAISRAREAKMWGSAAIALEPKD